MTPPHLLLEIKVSRYTSFSFKDVSKRCDNVLTRLPSAFLPQVDHDNIRDLLDRFQLAHKKEDTMLCVDSECASDMPYGRPNLSFAYD